MVSNLKIFNVGKSQLSKIFAEIVQMVKEKYKKLIKVSFVDPHDWILINFFVWKTYIECLTRYYLKTMTKQKKKFLKKPNSRGFFKKAREYGHLGIKALGSPVTHSVLNMHSPNSTVAKVSGLLQKKK